MNLQLTHLHSEFDKLHELHGDTNFNSIYGAGCTENPKYVFVFMNPTAKILVHTKAGQEFRHLGLELKMFGNYFKELGC